MALGLYELINNINKQIKGICCKIDNLDPGGGGGTNIYNSDGTLTGNRVLNGANNSLDFVDLNTFYTKIGSNIIGLYLDFSSNVFSLGDSYNIINGGALIYNGGVPEFSFTFLNITPLLITDNFCGIGDNLGNGILFRTEIINNLIKTTYQGNDIGLKLDFANTYYTLGDLSHKLILDGGNGEIYLSTTNYIELYCTNSLNFPSFLIDDINGIIKTKYQNNDIGLKLDFANQEYYFGSLTGGNRSGLAFYDSTYTYGFGAMDVGNRTFLLIDDSIQRIETWNSGSRIGLRLDFSSSKYELGQLTGGNQTFLTIDDATQIIKTTSGSTDIGLKLDFANSIYEFGQITSGNLTYIKIDDSGLDDIIINGKNIFIGDKFVSQNGTVLVVDDNNETISTFFQGSSSGINLEYFQTKYKFGQLSGGNTTYLTIDDAATYPVQIDGTNVSSNTAGAASGQFLKIKVGGVDYKIALLNP